MAAGGRRPQQRPATQAQLVVLLLMLAISTAAAAAAGTYVDSPHDRELMVNSSWMAKLTSPLSKSKAGSYAKLFKSTGSVGDLCQAGHLYCDAEQYNSYHEGLLQQVDKIVEEKLDIPVFFSESELVVGRQLTIVDPCLQSAALERNRRELITVRVVNTKFFKGFNDERAFLPAELAQTLPFTSTSASLVFKLDPSSTLARESSRTVQMCSKLQGGTAACATSLEGLQSLLSSPMVLGPHEALSVDALTTDSRHLSGGNNFTGKVVQVSLQATEGKRHALCHNLMYPSAVYFCHKLDHTRVYTITLQQDNHHQELLRAVAVCHMDTTGWNPRSLAFQNLLTFPGQAEACHWVLQGSVAFVSKY